MAGRFANEDDWFTATLALVVWAAHFMLLWAASSVFPGQAAARWSALLLTVAAAGGLIWLWRRAARRSALSVPALGIGLAAAAIAFNAVVALVG
jgi:hypothetical protein